MDTRNALIVTAVLNALVMVGAWLAFPHLPERIPTGWNFLGHVTAYRPRAFVFLIGPGLLATHALLVALLPLLLPRAFSVGRSWRVYLLLGVFTQAAIALLFGLIVAGSVWTDFPLDRAIFLVVSLLFAVCGNWLGKVRRNLLFGIRTPWTLMDERVWDGTCRIAARMMVFGGLCAMLAAAMAPLWTVSALLAASVVAPAIYSALLFQRLHARMR